MEIAIKTLPAAPVDISEKAVDEAVAACGGDARETVRALLAGQVHMGSQMLKMHGKISAGYTRRLPLARLDDVQGK